MDGAVLGDAVRRAEEWLEDNKQTFVSETDTGISFKGNLGDLLILELSGRWDYVDLRIPEGRWNYFAGMSRRQAWERCDPAMTKSSVKPVIVPADYPNDNDANAVAFSVLKPTESRAQEFLDEILACTNSEDIVQVHLDPDRPRIAPEVSANILSLFYTYNRGHEVQGSLKYLEEALALPQYETSRCYFVPEPLLYYSWRLLCIASGSDLDTIDTKRLPKELHTLETHLVRRTRERIGKGGDNSLCPATRLLICQSLGIENKIDVSVLLDLQEKDGSFGQAWYVRYGSSGIKISHRGFAFVLAVVALQRSVQALDRAILNNGLSNGVHH